MVTATTKPLKRDVTHEEILVFRTNIMSFEEIERLAPHLNSVIGIQKWNVDFDDREKILRIVSVGIRALEVIDILESLNIASEELEDIPA